MAKAKLRTHNEWFRTVKLGGRKTCPTCGAKRKQHTLHLGREGTETETRFNDDLWSWGEYVNAKWRTVKYFCRECFDKEVRQPLLKHAAECGCKIELVGYWYCGEHMPFWLTLKPRVTNDFGKRVSLRTMYRLLVAYHEARLREVTHKQAIAYAMASQERRIWHTGAMMELPPVGVGHDERWQEEGYRNWHKPMSQQGWYKGTTRIDVSEKRFKELMVNSIGGPVSLELPPKKALMQAIRQYKPRHWRTIKRALANYRRVVGRVESGQLYSWLFRGYFQSGQDVKAWLKVDRASKLFIKGMGGFDVAAALRGMERNDDHWSRTSEFVVPLRPEVITAKGYGIPGEHVLEELRKSPIILAWVIRWRSWWQPASRLRRMQRLDELFGPRHRRGGEGLVERWLTEQPDMHPNMVLQRIRAWYREQREMGHEYQGSFDWLATVPPQETPVGLIAPVQDTKQLRQVGKDLHNCASQYANAIAGRNCMLCVLTDSKGKPIALGELNPDGTWGQISGVCNEEVEDAILRVFEQYVPVAMGAIWDGPVPTLPKEPLALEGTVAE